MNMFSCWGGRWTLWNRGDISHSPAKKENYPNELESEIPQRDYGPEPQLSSSKKEEAYPMGQCHHKNPDPARNRFTFRDLKAKVVRLGDGWQVDGRSIGSLDCFQLKWADSISAFPTDSQTRPPLEPNKRRKRRIRTWAEHSRPQGRPPLMGTLGVHQNIPASNTKLTHSLGIYSIGPPLVIDKLIPVNARAITSLPEMSLLLEVECKLGM